MKVSIGKGKWYPFYILNEDFSEYDELLEIDEEVYKKWEKIEGEMSIMNLLLHELYEKRKLKEEENASKAIEG